jgi:nucleoid-associated protein YgaU
MPPTPAQLKQTDNEELIVRFQFNPKTITVSHSAPLKDIGVQKSKKNEIGTDTTKAGSKDSNLTQQQILEKLGKTTIKFSELYFDGTDQYGNNVLKNCGTLLGWSYATEYSKAMPPGGTEAPDQVPELEFSWQDFQLGYLAQKPVLVYLTQVDVKYERFTSSGEPIRATVSITLQPTSINPLGTNPTSGGLPGRSGHMVITGETLAGIAVAEYGTPASWRELAEINGIDDPLRIRPGSTLYTPGQGELAGTGQA